MAAGATLPRADTEEPEVISIEVKLSAADLRNVRRILEGKFEPETDAWLVVKVRRNAKRS